MIVFIVMNFYICNNVANIVKKIEFSNIQDTTFSVTFQSDLVSQAQILHSLKRKGYEVAVQ